MKRASQSLINQDNYADMHTDEKEGLFRRNFTVGDVRY